jgi:hypothetical protein
MNDINAISRRVNYAPTAQKTSESLNSILLTLQYKLKLLRDTMNDGAEKSK